jgi:hypothetical protein
LEGARDREPWAAEAPLQHLACPTAAITATRGNNEPTSGPLALRDRTVEQTLSSTASAGTTAQSDPQLLKQPATAPLGTVAVNSRTALEAAPFGASARASDGSSISDWRDYKTPGPVVGPRERPTTVKAEPAPSPPRPGRGVAPPNSPTNPRLDRNERSKSSALYRLRNPPVARQTLRKPAGVTSSITTTASAWQTGTTIACAEDNASSKAHTDVSFAEVPCRNREPPRYAPH